MELEFFVNLAIETIFAKDVDQAMIQPIAGYRKDKTNVMRLSIILLPALQEN